MVSQTDKPEVKDLEVSVKTAALWQAQGCRFLDVRGASERELAHIPNDDVYSTDAPPPEDEAAIVYCASGKRSARVVHQLRHEGYSRVYSLAGGMQAWQAAGHRCVLAGGLSEHDLGRYQRQMLLPQIGAQGQLRLKKARILLIGAGGLGSPAGLYLAAAGVGALGVVDNDTVELSNLHRQVLYTENDMGSLKTEVAQKRLLAVNPELELIGYPFRLNAETVDRVFQGWDLVIDGSDNFSTRYLVNDACLQRKLPLVSGAATAFEGQVSLFDPAGDDANPCYRCLYPSPPSGEQARDCNTVGVLGPVPGLVAMVMVTEALKYLLEIGQPLVGKLLLIDVLSSQFTTLGFGRRPECLCQGLAKEPRRSSGAQSGE